MTKNGSSPDRITVSLGRKISITKYEPLELFIGYSCDKPSKVSPAKGIQAVEALVIREFERLVAKIEKGEVKGARQEIFTNGQ